MKIYLKSCYAGIGCQHDVKFVKLRCELQQDDAENCEEHLNREEHLNLNLLSSPLRRLPTPRGQS